MLLNSLDNLPATFDSLGARLDNAALLERAGVRIAFTLNGKATMRAKCASCGNAVAHGLGWDAALAAHHRESRRESSARRDRAALPPGQVADVVLWSGDPLEVNAVADQVWIAGRPVEMRSRQTELRDRYLRPGEKKARACRSMITHSGGCHCGRVRFEVRAPAALPVSECNCSMCSKSGLSASDRAQVALQAAERRRGAHRIPVQYRHGAAPLLFGLRHQIVLRAPLASRGYSVNARCLDEGTVEALEITPINGKEWEKQYPGGRGEPLEE